VSATDELLPFIDNGGRRSYIRRRTRSRLFCIPDRRRSDKNRRINIDRRKILNKRRIKGQERRHYFKD
jgi:hypothetical protein